MSYDLDRLWADFMPVPDTLPVLGRGGHAPGSTTPCAMEAASWLVDEPWSAAPKAVHPVIAAVARAVNDNVEDDERQQLWPLILASLGTSHRFRPVLHLRLQRFAKRGLEAAGIASPAVWQRLLVRYGELTGEDPWKGSPRGLRAPKPPSLAQASKRQHSK